MADNLSAPHEAEFLFYSGPDGKQHIEVFYAGETVWLTQKRMAELFGVEVNTINYHLKEVFGSSELDEDSVIRKFRTTAADGKKYLTAFYNLDAIISVGYRVNSLQATAFRKWATATLREYMVKGFVLDDERLAQGTHFGKDYFEELDLGVQSFEQMGGREDSIKYFLTVPAKSIDMNRYSASVLWINGAVK